MPHAVLIKLQPLDPGTGTRVSVYASSVNDPVNGPKVNGLNGVKWEPAITQVPMLGIALFNGDFTNAIEPGQASLAMNLEVLKKGWPSIDTYVWAGCPVEIYSAVPGTAWPWTTRFKGNQSSMSIRGRSITLGAQVDRSPFDVDVLNQVYAGTGGAAGGSDLKNKAKPLVIGWASNVEPVLIDTTNSVYQFSGYGAIEAVTKLYERGSEFAASAGDYASYAALVAATIAPGAWATCLAEGMVRLGAPQYGIITGDVKGHKVGSTTPRLTGAIINALVTISGISTSLINTTSISALDSDKPYNINLSLADQSSFLSVAQELARAANWNAGIDMLGKFFVTKPTLSGTAAFTLNTKGLASPQVIDCEENSASPPYWRTIMGANRSWRVHTPDEIALLGGEGSPRIEAPAGRNFTANYAGTLDAEQLPANFSFKRYRGDTDVSATSTWTVESQSGITGGTVTISNGVATIPTGCSIGISSQIKVKAVRDGVDLFATVTITRTDAPAPSTGGGGGGGGGTTVSDSSLNSVSGTTKTAISDEMTVKTGSSGAITFAGLLSINASAAPAVGTFGAVARWQYKPVGGSYSDVGTGDIGESYGAYVYSESGFYYADPGEINVADSITGLSANTDYVVKLMAARDSSTPTKTIGFGGSVTAIGS